jgi:hypothetical protein
MSIIRVPEGYRFPVIESEFDGFDEFTLAWFRKPLR